MSPEIDFAIETIKVEGDIGVKRTYGSPNSRLTLCLKKQDIIGKLSELKGQEIFGLSGDNQGIVRERSTVRISNSKLDTLRPIDGERFFLKGLEESLGDE